MNILISRAWISFHTQAQDLHEISFTVAMAEPQSSPPAVSIAPNPELDIQKLHTLPSEQQELYLLTFAADLARLVTDLDATGASSHQIYVKKELLKIINLGSPAPSRLIRNNLGRCFAGIFAKGDRKLLFESINELAGILTAGKEKELITKHAAAHCLGAIYESAGDSAINLSSLACTSLLRALKSAQNHTGFRGSIFKAFGRIFISIGGSADEPLARDVWKQARNAAYNDKSFFVQRAACFCLEQLISKTPFFDNSNDFDKLQNAVWKALDSQSVPVRHSAASCISSILVKSHTENPNNDSIPRLKKPKKASKKQDQTSADDGEIERSGSPAPEKPATLLSFSLSDMLRQLSIHYCRTSTTNRARASLALCYVKILKGLGGSLRKLKAPASGNFKCARCVPITVGATQEGQADLRSVENGRHLFFDLLSHPSIVHNRYRLLITRRFVQIILEDVAGRAILGESAQLNAARCIINEILKDYPQALKERPPPSKQALTAALSTLTSLITNLGAATSSIADLCREALLQVLTHPSYTVQVHTSDCLRAFALACPQQLLPTLTICMNSVNRELGHLTGPRHSPRRCAGYANGLAALLSTSREHPL